MHEDIVKARRELGISQARLATLAGIARSRLQELERGENVTIETIRKVVACLPNLTMKLEWTTPQGREAEIRQALTDLAAVTARLLRLFDVPAADGPSPDVPSPTRAPIPSDAHPAAARPATEAERMERLRRISALIDAGTPPIEEEH